MTIFGVTIPVWVIVSVLFLGIYILFDVLEKRRVKKLKAKREAAEAKKYADDI